MSSEIIYIKIEPGSPSPKATEVEDNGAGTCPTGIPEFINIKKEHYDEKHETTVSVKLERVDSDDPDDELERVDSNDPDDEVSKSHTITDSGCERNWILPLKVELTVVSDNSQSDVKGRSDQIFPNDEERNKAALEIGGSKKKGRFVCHICTKSYASKHNQQRHMLTHSKQKYECQFCQKQYWTQHQYDTHVRKHYTLKEYKCRKCDNIMKVPYHLQKNAEKRCCDECRQANQERRLAKKRYVCPMCGKEFEREYSLKSHLLKHTTDRPFICDLCQMNFKHKSALFRHIQLHNGSKPYACKFCSKTFTHPGLMKPHMRSHTGEKPYPCPICKKMFSHKHNMQRHLLIHGKEKNLICTVCNKKFPKESRLKYHMRTHTSEKCFPCRHCPKKFAYRQNIFRHYKKKHPDAPFDCKDTDASVASKLWDEVVNKKTRSIDPKKEVAVTVERLKEEDEYIIPDKDTADEKPLRIKEEVDEEESLEGD